MLHATGFLHQRENAGKYANEERSNNQTESAIAVISQ